MFVKLYQLKEAQFVLNTILEIQPQESVTDQDKSSSDIAYEIADMIKGRIQFQIDITKCNPEHLKVINNAHFILLLIVRQILL